MKKSCVTTTGKRVYFVRIGQHVMTWLWNKADLVSGKEIEISFRMRKFILQRFFKDQEDKICSFESFLSLKEMIRQFLYFNSLKFVKFIRNLICYECNIHLTNLKVFAKKENDTSCEIITRILWTVFISVRSPVIKLSFSRLFTKIFLKRKYIILIIYPANIGFY